LCSRLDAILDQDDTQISATSVSHVSVRPVIEGQEEIPRGDSVNVQIHVDGGATLMFVHKKEGVETRSKHLDWRSSETFTTPFTKYANQIQQTPEEICWTEESSTDAGVWSLELCFNRLVECDGAGCMHDLVRLIVSLHETM